MNLSQMLSSALNNPDQRASQDDVGGLLGTVQQLSGRAGVDPGSMQTLMSTVGRYTRGALREKRQREGAGEVELLVDRHAGFQEDPGIVSRLFSAQEQDRMAAEASQQTGMGLDTIKGLLPMVVPMILKMLQGGSSTRGGANAMLSGFLDADRDGDVDVGDAMRHVTTFFGNR